MTTIKKSKDKIKFMDFCAGIGAGRLGLEKLGMECVGFSEIDKNAEKTYREFFGQEESNFGDLMKINTKNLPDFDLMIAGFPCQTFSVIGNRKGMIDKRGQVIFGLIKIMLEMNLKYFILENVKGLTNHDNGRTLKIILEELSKAGYEVVFSNILNSLNYGVPQMRERIYLVGIRKDLLKTDRYNHPEVISTPSLEKYLIDDDELEFNDKVKTYKTFLKFLDNKYNKNKYSVNDLLKNEYSVIDTRQSDLRIYNGKVPTLRTGRHGILYIKNGKFRKLSGCESLLLQGFPKEMTLKVKNKINNMHLLAQAGNAMTVNVIERVGKNLLEII